VGTVAGAGRQPGALRRHLLADTRDGADAGRAG
jgi:hypothetical protein